MKMLRNSAKKLWDILTLDDGPQPEYKHISHLNHHVHLIKEMDSTKNTVEIMRAIEKLKKWRDTLQQDNDSLSLPDLQQKRRVLKEAQSRFNARFYTMIICIIANASTMNFGIYSALVSNLSKKQKTLAAIAPGIGIIEGTIHLYKAKRFFAQKSELTKVEIESVDLAIQKKRISKL